MKTANSSIKVGIFYDGNFFLHVSNYYNYFHPRHSRLSINGLHRFICSRVARAEGVHRSEVLMSEAHYFRGRLSAIDASQRANQLYNDRVFDEVLMSEGVHSHYSPLRNVAGRREERGTDVWLSLEAYDMAVRGKIDVAVLIISDTDYVPLLRKLNSLGIKVMVLGWEFDYVNDEGVKVVTRTSSDLVQIAQYPLAMQEIIERGLLAKDSQVEALFIASQTLDSDVEGDLDDDGSLMEISEIFSLKNNFGFIRYPNNNLFFHAQDLIDCEFSDLSEGDTVEFTIGKNHQHQDVAKNVRKIV